MLELKALAINTKAIRIEKKRNSINIWSELWFE